MTVFALILTPLLAAALSAVMPRAQQRFIEGVAVAATVLETLFCIAIITAVLRSGVVNASVFFQTDALGAFVAFFAALVGLAASIHAVSYLREEMRKGFIGFRRVRQHYVLFHLFLFAMFAAVTTGSPLLMWISIEATTLATAFLITFYNKPSALEAGWKHLMINSVGLLLGFLGTLLFLNAAASAGATDPFISWGALRGIAPSMDPILVTIAFIFVIVGFGTKVGLVPLHTWLPDAHSKAPIPISALLSGVLLNVALIAVLRFRGVTDGVLDPHFTQELLIGFGLVSVFVAAFMIFGQKNYKRMLAYSSIENMGLLGIGFGVGGAATAYALLHMLYHALFKALLFLSAGNFFLKYSSTKIAKIRGALTLVPVSATIFLAGLLALVGVPPSGIFFSKLGILAAGMREFPYVMLLVLVAISIVFAGFMRHASAMLFSEPAQDIPRGEIGDSNLASIVFLALVCAILSISMPAGLRELITQSAALIR